LNPKLSATPSLKQMALDHIGDLAAAIRTADPSLSPQQAVAKAAQTPEGRQAYAYIRQPGSHLPLFEVLEHMAKGQAWLQSPALRDLIEAERATPAGLAKADAAHDRYMASRRADLEKLGVTKESGGGGSGPRGRIEDPKTRGPKAPGDSLANPADVILAEIYRQALAAAPAGTSQAAATAAFLQTQAGNALHADFNAARAAQL
jgi:hypothetical protein